jgi:LacI family transcriptional regulator
MVRIKDIAEICKVSPMTVSRALNDSSEISQNTKERILKVCEEMGYRPNAAARTLIRNKTNMIGLIIPDITNQYYSYLSKGVSSYLENLGYGLILCNSDRNIVNEKMYLDFLTQKRVDGVILIPLSTKAEDYSILVNSVPFVLIDNKIEGVNASFIGNDNFKGAKEVVTHMLAKGYKRIGAILSYGMSVAKKERLRGYMEALKQCGMEIDENIIIHSSANFEAGYNIAGQLIDRNVDGIFAISDTVAMGVIKYCYTHSIRIPQDLGLAGYDDIEQAAMLPVPLTTVNQNKFQVGNTAAKVLIDEIEGHVTEKQNIIFQPEIVIRKSCGE